MALESWFYFLSIEKDFAATTDFVEVSPQNGGTYSNEFAKLLLLIGSEIDVVAKLVCRDVEPKRNVKNIDDYRQVLTSQFKDIHTVEVRIPRYTRSEQPWLEWGQEKSPFWWKAYNDVKHHRDTRFADANQENVLKALCGLLVMNLYLYRIEFRQDRLHPYPSLLNGGFPEALMANGDGTKLPGT